MKARNILFILMVLLVASVTVNVLQSVKTPASATIHDHSDSKQLYTCGMHPNVVQEGPGTCPICGMNLTPMKGSGAASSGERKVLYWRAPMDPNYISDKPGKSPMGMELVPVYEDEVQGSAISIDPAMVQTIGVRFTTVERRNLSRTIETNGVVMVDESRRYRVNPKVSGWIEKLHVNKTGQYVQKGEPLLDIYSPELVTAQEEYLLALRGYHALVTSSLTSVSTTSKDLLNATRERLRYWDITDRQIASLESSNKVSRVMTLYSPASGVIIQKSAIEGDFSNAGMNLFQIADLSKIWIEAQVYEYEIGWVNIGQQAKIRLPYNPSKVYYGEVRYIYPYLDPKTRTATIRVILDNPDGELKPEMYANVHVDTRERKNVVALPREAVVRSGKRDIVFLAVADGKFLPREVELGLEADDSQYEVLSGVNEGNRIVTSAQFLLDSEAQLQEALQKLMTSSDLKTNLEHTSHEQSHNHIASGATMESLFATDSIYWCPMHHEIVTTESDARCPLCNMFLEPIPAEELTSLRESNPYGCVMCPVVRPEDEKDEKCSVCGMFLKPIENEG